MRLLRFIPIKLTICIVLGILIGYYSHINSSTSILLLFSSLVVMTLLYVKAKPRKYGLLTLLMAMTAVVIGICAINLGQQENYKSHFGYQEKKGERLWHLKIAEVMKPTHFSERYLAYVEGVDSRKSSGKLLLVFSGDSTHVPFEIDDELLVYGPIDSIKPPLNPHQFSYRAYLNDLGIAHQLQVATSNYLGVEKTSTSLYGFMAAVRNKISSQLKKAYFGDEQLAVMQAILLGQRNDLSEATYADYKNAGAVHILAVSGLHIGILLLLLQFILRPLEYLPKGKILKLITIVMLLWAFALLAGLSASIVRAVTMFTFVAYALYLNRPGNTYNILALSIIFILLAINPMLLFQVGFQLSYAAVLAIVWGYPLLQKFWHPKLWALRKLWQLLSVSIAAQIGVLPISLYYFHQFPGLFFISNILIIPFLGLILGMGILVITLALAGFLPGYLVKLYDAIIALMNESVAWVAGKEAFVFRNIPFDFMQLILTYAIIISLVLVLTKSTFKRGLALLTAIISFQAWVFYTFYETQRKETMFVAHQSRNSVILQQSGSKLFVFSEDKNAALKLARDYQVGEHMATLVHHPLENGYFYGNEKLLVIDSSGVIPSKATDMDYLLLTQSPKMNLERLLVATMPKRIIADGSNYSSFINRWKATCLKRKIPFHYTGEKGAYYFRMD
ncbi:MAG: ComEC family competence protein [Maribacter sp.]|nr:ComEC family competence protein [Maribacter sp.]